MIRCSAHAVVLLSFILCAHYARCRRPRLDHSPASAFVSPTCLEGVYAHGPDAAAATKLCDTGYRFRITSWHARLGNVLHQLAHAVFVAERTKSTLATPGTELLTRHEWNFRVEDKHDTPCSHVVITGGEPNFWHSRDCALLAHATPAIKRDVLTRHVLPHLKLPRIHVSPANLVMYVRSGDVFAGNGGSEWYVQPPLSFYRAVLARRQWEAITLITDHANATLLNPVISTLLRDYPAITTRSSSLATDVATLLAATNIVSARSTLMDSLLLMGAVKTCAYLPACEGNEEVRASGGVCYAFDGYTPQGTWQNSDQQRQAMLTFKGVKEGRVWGHGC